MTSQQEIMELKATKVVVIAVLVVIATGLFCGYLVYQHALKGFG